MDLKQKFESLSTNIINFMYENEQEQKQNHLYTLSSDVNRFLKDIYMELQLIALEVSVLKIKAEANESNKTT